MLINTGQLGRAAPEIDVGQRALLDRARSLEDITVCGEHYCIMRVGFSASGLTNGTTLVLTDVEVEVLHHDSPSEPSEEPSV